MSDKTDNLYPRFINRLEPNLLMIDADTFHASVAISLKRIADALEQMADDTQTQYRWNALGDTIYSAIVRAKS